MPSRLEAATLASARIQRARIALDVARVDLEVAETVLGPNHATAWFFRDALTAAQQSWDRLRAEFGGAAIEASLQGPTVAVVQLSLAENPWPALHWIAILGRTFAAEPLGPTRLAPIRWRLDRLTPPLAFGPYHVCQLADGAVECDCAEWIYREEAPGQPPCKHISALADLGWIMRR